MEGKTRRFNYDKMDSGQLVAFRHEKLDTGMIQRINRVKRLAEVETKAGRVFIVPFEKIVWVKLDFESYWPTQVYNELKGGEPCNWEGTEEDDQRSGNKRECKEII